MSDQDRRDTAQALIGQRVRSFDFYDRDIQGERACYVTGTVAGILKAGDLADDGKTRFHDCDRYVIRTESRIFGGEPTRLACEGQQFFPPLNGTPTSLDDTTDYVAPLNQEGA